MRSQNRTFGPGRASRYAPGSNIRPSPRARLTSGRPERPKISHGCSLRGIAATDRGCEDLCDLRFRILPRVQNEKYAPGFIHIDRVSGNEPARPRVDRGDSLSITVYEGLWRFVLSYLLWSFRFWMKAPCARRALCWAHYFPRPERAGYEARGRGSLVHHCEWYVGVDRYGRRV